MERAARRHTGPGTFSGGILIGSLNSSGTHALSILFLSCLIRVVEGFGSNQPTFCLVDCNSIESL